MSMLEMLFWDKKIGVKNIRTGISWYDFHQPEGEEWIDWLIEDCLRSLRFVYTPHIFGLKEKISLLPKNIFDYAFFVRKILNKHGYLFDFKYLLWKSLNTK